MIPKASSNWAEFSRAKASCCICADGSHDTDHPFEIPIGVYSAQIIEMLDVNIGLDVRQYFDFQSLIRDHKERFALGFGIKELS